MILRRLGTLLVSLVVVVPVGSALAQASANELPNLVPLPVFDVQFDTATDSDEPALRFSVATANRGDFALDLLGTPEDPVEESSPAHQCVAWTTDRVCEGREEVGRFVWHPAHGHYHFEDFALYELRRFRRDGTVNMKPSGLVATSGKVSFCLLDVEWDSDEGPDNPIYWLPHPLYLSCVAGSGFQGISPGWRDVYTWATPGQEFPVAGLADGRYAVVVRSDPSDRLYETTNVDNLIVTGIEISKGVTKVEVFCAGEPGELGCEPLETTD